MVLALDSRRASEVSVAGGPILLLKGSCFDLAGASPWGPVALREGWLDGAVTAVKAAQLLES